MTIFGRDRARPDVVCVCDVDSTIFQVGTGLGPTLEFYTMASRAFLEPWRGLWRDPQAVQGCYPAPLPMDTKQVRP